MLALAAFLAAVALVVWGTLTRRLDVSITLPLGAVLYGALASVPRPAGPRWLRSTTPCSRSSRRWCWPWRSAI
ncbi:MAG: hypothetical protein RQ839_11110 [Thermoproteus sp.]|nr:hypothetical protein [Thermoproteus sp.]MDT7882686.1 hypothetical protein [Thermoproteus sp.]